MTHDPLCPWNQPCPGSYERGPHEFVPLDPPDLPLVCYHCTSTECRCDLVAKVRVDERTACIAAVEATIQHDDACKSVIPGRDCNCTRFDTLASLRKVQPLAQWWGEEKDWFHDPKGHWVTYADHVAAVEAMRAACIAAVEEVPVRGTWTAYKVIEETLKAIREVQP